MIIYCLDNSDAACRSEDYPCGNRLAFELAVVRTVSRSLLAPKQTQDLEGPANGSDIYSLAVISSAGRPALTVAPTADASALLGLDVACQDGERSQFLGALRLALLASKRSSTARVLAFLASQADLPPEQCRQLSRSFADAGVSLDLVVLCPDGELSSDSTTSLELLTSVSSYTEADEPPPLPDQICPRPEAAVATSASASNRPRRPTGRSAAASAGVGSAAAGDPAGLRAGGQRLLYFPPPDLSLALWQQLEPLMEQLQLDGGPGMGAVRRDPDAGSSSEDDRSASSQRRTSGSGPNGPSTSGRPPLPRPPRQRAASGGRTATSSASASTSISTSTPSAGGMRSGFAATGPLTSRSGGARGGVSVGTCRYESLDSLQHLSLDGFLRSWLPSYANISRVMPALPQGGSPSGQGQVGGGGGGTYGGGSSGSAGSGRRLSDSAAAGAAGSGAGPGRMCYISVYRLQLPRWHKLLEVHAGCMYELQLPEGVPPPSADAAGAAATAAAGGAAEVTASVADAREADDGANAASMAHRSGSGSDSATEGGVVQQQSQQNGCSSAVTAATADPAPAPRRTVVVPRAPCPVQVHFSTRCSSAAAASTASVSSPSSSSESGGRGGGGRCYWVCPDLRRGSLTMVASVEDQGVVKLLWNERPRAGPGAGSGAGAGGAQRQYGNIFMAAPEEAADGGVDPAAAELELTLSPTRSQFRVVPHARGGAVLEVLSPRCAVHRPRQPSQGGQADGGAVPLSPSNPASASSSTPTPASSAAAAPASHSAGQSRTGDTASRGSGGPSSPRVARAVSSPYMSYLPQPTQQRYFFWLQQDWRPPAADADGHGGREGVGAGSEPPRPGPSTSEADGTQPTGSWATTEPDDVIAEAADSLGSRREAESSQAADVTRGSEPALLDRGCHVLTEKLQALLECPPEFDPHKHGNRVRCNSTPLQLGPLPFALVEEIMRASGRELNPDGTVTTHTHHSNHNHHASSSASTSASGAFSSARDGPHQGPRHPGTHVASHGQGNGHHSGHHQHHHDGGVGLPPAKAVRVEQPVPVPTIDRADSLGLPGLVASGPPTAAAAAFKSAAAAPTALAGNAKAAAVAAGGSAFAAERRLLSAAYKSSSSATTPSTQTPEKHEVVRGFARTTYSRGAAAPPPPRGPATGAGGSSDEVSAAGLHATSAEMAAAAVAVAAAAAAAALVSHPLDELDWASDLESQEQKEEEEEEEEEEGEDASTSGSGAATPGRPACRPPSSDPSLLVGSTTAEPRVTACPCGGISAATAAAAAAAAAGATGASLVGVGVGAVDTDAAGSCQKEDSSLLFDLD